MAIGWFAALTSGHRVEASDSPSSSNVNSDNNNNKGVVEPLSTATTTTTMFSSHRHHRHNHHRKIPDHREYFNTGRDNNGDDKNSNGNSNNVDDDNNNNNHRLRLSPGDGRTTHRDNILQGHGEDSRIGGSNLSDMEYSNEGNSGMHNGGSYSNGNNDNGDGVDGIVGRGTRGGGYEGLYDRARRKSLFDGVTGSESHPWWYSDRQKGSSSPTHWNHARLRNGVSNNDDDNNDVRGDNYGRYDDKGDNSYYDNGLYPRSGEGDHGRMAYARTVRHVSDDVSGSRSRLGLVGDSSNGDGDSGGVSGGGSDFRSMAKRTVVKSIEDKQFDSVPFNTDENSNTAHFDVQFFPEYPEGDEGESGFTDATATVNSNNNNNQNDTTTVSGNYFLDGGADNSGAGGAGIAADGSSSNSYNIDAKEYLGDAAASADPFSSVPWGSSDTNNAPNVAELQKGVYSNKYSIPGYGDESDGAEGDLFDQNKFVNSHPFLNHHHNHHHNNNTSLTPTNNYAQSEEGDESRNPFAISSFFQDGNFTGSFSHDPVQTYHLDYSNNNGDHNNNNYNNYNDNNFFSPHNVSTIAATTTSTSPSSLFENMENIFTGSGDLVFNFNGTSAGANSNLTDLSGDPTSSGDVYLWVVLLMAPLVLFGIAGNTLVILAISLERRLQNITNYFLLSLAVTDLLVSLIVMPFSIINMITGRWLFGLLLCDFFVTSDVLMCTSSIFHLCFISAERYIGIRYPLWAKNKSKRVVLLKIVLVWTLAFAVTSPISILGVVQEENILVDGRCYLSNTHFIIYGSIFAFFIPLSIMVIMYILTVRMLNKQAKLCHKRRGEDGEVEPMIRRSTSSKRWQGRNRFYGGGGGGFQASFRNHDMKEHILDPSGNFHQQQQSVYEMGGGVGGGGGGLRTNVNNLSLSMSMSNTLPHYKSATSPNNSLLRRGVVNMHHHDARGNSLMMSSSSCGNSPMVTRNGMSAINKKRSTNSSSSSSHPDSLVVHNKNSKNGKHGGHQHSSSSRRSRSGGFFGDVINNKNGDADGKNHKRHRKNNSSSSEYRFCNGHRSDSSDDSSKDDSKSSGNLRSSSPNDNNNKLKDLVRKHHVALKAANILLMRRVDHSQNQNPNNLHHMTSSSGMPRTSTTTPPSSTKVSIRRDNSVRTEQKASKVLGVVFIIFLICWAPFFTVNILQVLCSSCRYSSTLFTSFVWLGYVSSTLNPIIYTIFNNIFRNTFIKLLCCRYRLLHRARRNSNLVRKENGMLASSTCSATFNTASTILTSTGNNCSIITTNNGSGNTCNISFRNNKASTSINAMDESKC